MFEQSARGKSDIYADFLPLANSRRIELLDNKRMAAQFVGLERRTGRSGKDSIAEPKGAHDDCCNSVAGVLVALDLDRRPALIRRDDLLVAEQPTKHARPQLFNAIVWLSPAGMCATAVFSYDNLSDVKLVLVDFDTGPWSPTIIPDAARRLDELCEAALERRPHGDGAHAFLIVQEQLEQPAISAMRAVFAEKLEAKFRRLGRLTRCIDVAVIDQRYLADPAKLILSAAAHVSMGEVKLSVGAMSKAAGQPLLESLDFEAWRGRRCGSTEGGAADRDHSAGSGMA